MGTAGAGDPTPMLCVFLNAWLRIDFSIVDLSI